MTTRLRMRHNPEQIVAQLRDRERGLRPERGAACPGRQTIEVRALASRHSGSTTGLTSRPVVAALALVVLAGLAIADEGVSDGTTQRAKTRAEYGIAKVLASVGDAHGQSTDYSKALQETAFMLQSTSDSPTFEFDSFIYGPSTDEPGAKAAARIIALSAHSHRATLCFGADHLPNAIFLDDALYTIGENRQWLARPRARWAYIVDADHFANFLDGERAPKDAEGFVSFDLGSYVRGAMESERPLGRWNAATRTLAFAKTTGAELRLKFRTPNDAQRFGTSLGEVVFATSNGGILSWSAFLIGPRAELKLRLPAADDLIAQSHIVEPPKASTPVDLRTDVPIATAMWHRFADLQLPDSRATEVIDPLVRTRNQEILITFSSLVRAKTSVAVEQLKTDPRAPAELDEFTRDLIRELRLTRWLIAQGIGDNGYSPDDPVLMWRGFEMAMAPNVTTGVYDAFVYFMQRTPPSPELQVELCDSIASLGVPLLAAYQTPSDALNDFQTAILHSHWQWACSKVGMDACVTVLESAVDGSSSLRVAIESLL